MPIRTKWFSRQFQPLEGGAPNTSIELEELDTFVRPLLPMVRLLILTVAIEHHYQIRSPRNIQEIVHLETCDSPSPGLSRHFWHLSAVSPY